MTLICTSFLAMLSLEGKHILLEQCKVMVCSVLLHSQLRNQGSREQHISCSLDTCLEIVSCAILLLFPYVSTNFNAENLVFSWNFRAYVSCKCERCSFFVLIVFLPIELMIMSGFRNSYSMTLPENSEKLVVS